MKDAGYLVKGTVAPVTEPVEHATVEESGTGGCAVLKTLRGRVHGEHDVQVLHHLASEPLVQLLVRVQHQTFSLRPLLALRH